MNEEPTKLHPPIMFETMRGGQQQAVLNRLDKLSEQMGEVIGLLKGAIKGQSENSVSVEVSGLPETWLEALQMVSDGHNGGIVPPEWGTEKNFQDWKSQRS